MAAHVAALKNREENAKGPGHKDDRINPSNNAQDNGNGDHPCCKLPDVRHRTEW